MKIYFGPNDFHIIKCGNNLKIFNCNINSNQQLCEIKFTNELLTFSEIKKIIIDSNNLFLIDNNNDIYYYYFYNLLKNNKNKFKLEVQFKKLVYYGLNYINYITLNEENKIIYYDQNYLYYNIQNNHNFNTELKFDNELRCDKIFVHYCDIYAVINNKIHIYKENYFKLSEFDHNIKKIKKNNNHNNHGNRILILTENNEIYELKFSKFTKIDFGNKFNNIKNIKCGKSYNAIILETNEIYIWKFDLFREIKKIEERYKNIYFDKSININSDNVNKIFLITQDNQIEFTNNFDLL